MVRTVLDYFGSVFDLNAMSLLLLFSALLLPKQQQQLSQVNEGEIETTLKYHKEVHLIAGKGNMG